MGLNDEEKKLLSSLLVKHGTYAVVKEISIITNHSCNTAYHDNHEAIIHSDSRVLNHAISIMRDSNSLRSLTGNIVEY